VAVLRCDSSVSTCQYVSCKFTLSSDHAYCDYVFISVHNISGRCKFRVNIGHYATLLMVAHFDYNYLVVYVGLHWAAASAAARSMAY